MAQKYQQSKTSRVQYKTFAYPKQILESVFSSQLRRNSKLIISNNKKDQNIGKNSSDFYTFQRFMSAVQNKKQIGSEKSVEKNVIKFSIARPFYQKILPSNDFKIKLVKPSLEKPVPNFSQQQISYSTSNFAGSNTVIQYKNTSNTQNLVSKPINNNTASNFRRSTNNYRRNCINQEQENHSNYLTKYQIIKQLGKGTFGVVYLAKIKTNDIKKQKKVQPNQDYLKFSDCRRQSIQRQSINLFQDQSNNLQQQQSPHNFQQYQQFQKQQLQNNIDEQKSLNNLTQSIQSPIHRQSQLDKNNKDTQKDRKKENQNKNEHNQKQQLFAIKIYQKFKMNKDPAKFKNIRKQINIMQNIQHDHIIKLYETVETLIKISLVTQYGGDQSLLDYLKHNYPLTETFMQKVARQLISALAYLHNKNIVHRDIKIQNILVINQNVKIIDFGFSTLTYKNRKLNSICGTPNYMAPELLSKKQYIGYLADVWSFGVVMFTIAQGRHPFKAENYNQLQRLANKGNYQFKMITNPIHQSFIKRILKVKPQERPQIIDLINHPWLSNKDRQSDDQTKK